MTALAPTLQSWFTDHLIGQRGASPNTIAAYRDCMRLLLCYAHDRHGVQPAQLDLAHLDDQTIAGFLEHARASAPCRRRHPQRPPGSHPLAVQLRVVPPPRARRADRPGPRHPHQDRIQTTVVYLDDNEVEAVLAAPDRRTWTGQRDHAWLLLMITTGIRVSELVTSADTTCPRGRPAHIVVIGKGRKQRIVPLDKTTAATLADLDASQPCPARGAPLHPTGTLRADE